MKYPSYLVHVNNNHDPKTGQFAPGDGDGDGVVNDNQNQKKGQYSAKIENYHKGNMFQEAYYIDKRGNKRSYQSYKEMPVEVQAAERARNSGKKIAREYGGQAVRTAASIGIQMAARSFLGF